MMSVYLPTFSTLDIAICFNSQLSPSSIEASMTQNSTSVKQLTSWLLKIIISQSLSKPQWLYILGKLTARVLDKAPPKTAFKPLTRNEM
jgi:hypothetical protein